MSDAMSYNFGAIEGVSSTVLGQVSNIESLLDQGQACVGKLKDAWSGSGAEQMGIAQQQWHGTSDQLKLALRDLANKVGQAGQDMQQQDAANAARFA